MAAYAIAARKVNTLILVHRRQLLDQWRERLRMFLDLPRTSIGRIGGGEPAPGMAAGSQRGDPGRAFLCLAVSGYRIWLAERRKRLAESLGPLIEEAAGLRKLWEKIQRGYWDSEPSQSIGFPLAGFDVERRQEPRRPETTRKGTETPSGEQLWQL